MNRSPPGSSVHGILQARILEWVAIPFSRRSSRHRDRTQVSFITGKFFTVWATREAQIAGTTNQNWNYKKKSEQGREDTEFSLDESGVSIGPPNVQEVAGNTGLELEDVIRAGDLGTISI